MDNDITNYYKLQKKALSLLTNPNVSEHFDTQCCLHFSVQPSFSPYTSWTVFLTPEKQINVHRMTWDRPFDAQRFSDPMVGLKHSLSPQPTIDERDFSQLTDAINDNLHALLHTMPDWSVSADAEKLIQLDGERWLLNVSNGSQSFQFDFIPHSLRDTAAMKWLSTLKQTLESID